MTQAIAIQHLSPESIDSRFETLRERIVNSLPDYIKVALIEKSTELECPLEATIEMAISRFLDEESLSFEDCLLAKRLKDSGANHQ
jgi:putative membrane protein